MGENVEGRMFKIVTKYCILVKLLKVESLHGLTIGMSGDVAVGAPSSG